MNIGCVLPTIKLLKTTMLKFLDDETITHCRPLVFAVLGVLAKDFTHDEQQQIKNYSYFGSLFQVNM
ncbi:hypothetical protein OUZ56_003312, partial [Daphnia magna]